MCAPELVYNVSNNGTSGDWYWEVITPEREIMARGLAPTSAQARADAVAAGALYTARPGPGWASARDGAEAPDNPSF